MVHDLSLKWLYLRSITLVIWRVPTEEQEVLTLPELLLVITAFVLLICSLRVLYAGLVFLRLSLFICPLFSSLFSTDGVYLPLWCLQTFRRVLLSDLILKRGRSMNNITSYLTTAAMEYMVQMEMCVWNRDKIRLTASQ
jgi:hypothetical protein